MNASSDSTRSQGAFLFIGQAGCQIGSALWMLYNAEHCVQPDGVGLSGDSNKGEHICFYKGSLYFKEDEFHRGFCYHELEQSGKYVPRTLFVDLEPMVIDEIRTGAYRNLFSEDDSFNEYSKVGDGSGIFSRAYNSIGRCIIGNLMNTVRHIAEKCHRLNVFNIARSYGGATGSGLGSLILENIHDRYPKVLIAESNILNSDCATSPTVEPYNTLFGLETSCTSGGITFIYNNTALKDICCKKLRISQPHYYHLNQVLSHGISGIYSSERFPGYGSCNINTILTNIIPYPRIQLAVNSMAPIIAKGVIRYEPGPRPRDLVNGLLSNEHTMFDINMNTGSFISCCVIYRGSVSPSTISASNKVFMNEKKVKMVEWSPRGIKSGHSPLSITGIPSFEIGVSPLSMTMLSNHTNISDALAKECFAAHVMLKKKAFLHWYSDHGMEEEDFNSALENAMLLTLDYKEIDTTPEKAMNLFSRSNEYEIDENGKRRRKKDDGAIKMEESDMLYSKMNTLKNSDDGLKKTASADNSKTIDDVTVKSDGFILLENAMKNGKGNDKLNGEVMRKICGDLTEKDLTKFLAIAEANGIDASFLTKANDEGFQVTYEMIQNLNKLIDLAQSESVTVTLTNDTKNTMKLLENALLVGDGNNKLNGEVLREVWRNLTENDRLNILKAAKVNDIDVRFLEQIDNPDFEVTYEMIQLLNNLVELSPPEGLSLEITDQLEKSAALLEEAIQSGEGNNVLHKEVLNNIFEKMSNSDKMRLLALAEQNGVDIEFLNNLDDPDIVVTQEMLQNLQKLMTQDSPKISTMGSVTTTVKSIAVLQDIIQSGEGNPDLQRDVLTEVCRNLTAADKKRILAVAEENGIDAEFLKYFEDPNLEVNQEMLERLNKLLELAPLDSNSLAFTNQSTRSMVDQTSQSMKLLNQAIKGGEGNEERNGELLREICSNLSEADRLKLQELAKLKGIDSSFLTNLDNPDFDVSIEMLQSLNLLLGENQIVASNEPLVASKPHKKKVKPEQALESIEPPGPQKYQIAVYQPRFCMAFTTRKTSTEYFVQCIKPKTTMNNINYFYKLYSRAQSA